MSFRGRPLRSARPRSNLERMAPLIRTPRQLAVVLAAAPPEQRAGVLEVLRPYLTFDPDEIEAQTEEKAAPGTQ